MRFLQPEMAAWLLATPVVGLCWTVHFAYKRRQQRRALANIPADRLGRSRRTTAWQDVVTLGLALLTVVCLAGAMMRPQIQWERRTPTFERQDLVLILDRSVSMRAQDVLPSRFERAVEEIQLFLRRKPNVIDRVALIGFAAASVVLSYPTDDLGSLFFYLDWVRGDPTPLYGTDIGGALGSAMAVVQRDPQRIRPVFVVVSDGDDHGRQLPGAIKAVATAGIRVHCIGIGSASDVPIPLQVVNGRQQFLRDGFGRVQTTRFAESTLRGLAAATGGRYYRSVTGGELRTALDSIAMEERRQIGTTTRTEYRDLYALLLTVAVAFGTCLAARL
jgi:Ca-activated chloride channel family protein